MRTVEVGVGKPYRVEIESGLLVKLGERVLACGIREGAAAVIVTDGNVAPLYLGIVEQSLKSSGFRTLPFVFEAGEKSKNPETYLRLINFIAENGIKRTDFIVALGGGVVGDTAGFAAATYMRGIAFVQVPTTLLAIIDSSVGGKTGVDLSCGKNLLGAFYQPRLVLADLDTLSTLPDGEWKNGIGEGVKYACLKGGRILSLLSDGIRDDGAELSEFCELCVRYKADIVEADERESGLRKLLNFGHTLGHAYEKSSGFTIPHGVAVAMGIAKMTEAAFKHGEISKEDKDLVLGLLDRYDLLADAPNGNELIDIIKLDKKAEDTEFINVIVIKGMGKCEIRKVSFDELVEYIN